MVGTQLKTSYLVLCLSRNVLFEQLQRIIALEQLLGRTKQIRREALQHIQQMLHYDTCMYTYSAHC